MPPRKPIDRFSWELLHILGDTLTEARIDRDVFDLRVIAALGAGHNLHHLLYEVRRRDGSSFTARLENGAMVQFHDAATRYYYHHMAYSLSLAPKRKEDDAREHATNMHRLYLALCRHGVNVPADELRMERSQVCPVAGAGGALEALVGVHARQRQAVNESELSELTRNRVLDSGPLWLRTNDAASELSERMSLFDVLEALPLPLHPAFMSDTLVQKLLTRVLDSVNERHALLCQARLPLEPWLERDQPSIGALRQLRRLRSASTDLLRRGECTRHADALRRAFEMLKGTSRRYAGVNSFEAFVRTEYGSELLNRRPVSLDELADAPGDALSESSAEVTALRRDSDKIEWLEQASKRSPQLFTPLIRALFHGVLVEDRAIDELVVDDEFRRLVCGSDTLAELGIGVNDGCAPGDEVLALALKERALEVIRFAKNES